MYPQKLNTEHNSQISDFKVAVQGMRSNDMVCIGIFNRDQQDMLELDVQLFLNAAGHSDPFG